MKAVKLQGYEPHYIKHDVLDSMVWKEYFSKNQRSCAKFLHLALASISEKKIDNKPEKRNVSFNYSAKVTSLGIRETYRFGDKNQGLCIELNTTKNKIEASNGNISKCIEQLLGDSNYSDKIQNSKGEWITSVDVKEVVEYMTTRFDFKLVHNEFGYRGNGKYQVGLEFVYNRGDWSMLMKVDLIMRIK